MFPKYDLGGTVLNFYKLYSRRSPGTMENKNLQDILSEKSKVCHNAVSFDNFILKGEEIRMCRYIFTNIFETKFSKDKPKTHLKEADLQWRAQQWCGRWSLDIVTNDASFPCTKRLLSLARGEIYYHYF